MITPKHGDNKVWRVRGDEMPREIIVGYSDRTHGWSLGEGDVPWSQCYATEYEALQVARNVRVKKIETLTREIDNIDKRIDKMEVAK